MAKRTKDEFTRDWIIENSVEILSRYEPGVLTIRALHYQLKFGIFGVEIRRIALMEQQVIEWKLPPTPAKETDSRTANWDGLGQVELDAVKPEKLISLLDDAINDIFDRELYDELLERESDEREQFQTELKRYVEDDL